MPDYKKMYFHMAGRLADIIEQMQRLQQDMEAEYVEARPLALRLEQKLPETESPPPAETDNH